MRKTFSTWKNEHKVKKITFYMNKVKEYIDNKDWYKKSYDMFKDVYKDKSDLFIGILASCSQQNTVEANLSYAIEIFNAIMDNKDYHSINTGIADWKIKENIRDFLNDKELKGNKIKAFYEALSNTKDSIVIDRWTLRVFNINNRDAPTKKDIEYITKIINDIAKRLNMLNSEVQACLWSYAKNELSDKEYYKDYSDYSKYFKNTLEYYRLKDSI